MILVPPPPMKEDTIVNLRRQVNSQPYSPKGKKWEDSIRFGEQVAAARDAEWKLAVDGLLQAIMKLSEEAVYESGEKSRGVSAIFLGRLTEVVGRAGLKPDGIPESFVRDTVTWLETLDREREAALFRVQSMPSPTGD